MARLERRVLARVAVTVMCTAAVNAQTRPLSWDEVRERFIRNNPSVQAAGTAVQESKANELTAGLRPNPELGAVLDEFRIFSPPIQPFQNSQLTPTVSQLIERRNKRGLRVESAKYATSGVNSDRAEQIRQLTFQLRDSFVRTLQAKSVVDLAQENLGYYDKVIEVNKQRLSAGDISRVDFDRVALQRVNFESDLLNAQVGLRTAKIQLLALMNERTPVDQFDVTGDFDFKETLLLLPELRQMAVEERPDLRSANTAIAKAQIDNKLAWANGSTDPIVGLEYQRNGGYNTLGFSVQVPLRIFDRNQGEKERTALEIRRTGQLRDAVVTSIYRDIDSAYATIDSVRNLLRSYKQNYLEQAARVRDTISFAYQRGGASLLEFLDAQKSYRDTQLNYRNLIASYLSAANQLNLAVGREVIP